jgi:pyrroloquinoline quinone biosynthesis protein E
LELASAQYYGWAFANRDALLPGEEEVRAAERVAGERVAAEAADRLWGRMEVVFVLPDYFADRPQPCMHGWGRRYLTVNTIGEVLPCPTSGSISGLSFESVRDRPLRAIWEESDAFQRFRGTSWMREPCRECPLREVDHGGCRCQAALLTGDPANPDPACSLAPHRVEVETARMAGRAEFPSGLVYRSDPTGWVPSGGRT